MIDPVSLLQVVVSNKEWPSDALQIDGSSNAMNNVYGKKHTM